MNAPVGELASINPLSNAERYAQYIIKRGAVPFYRVWPDNATRLSLQGAQVQPRPVESRPVLLRRVK